MNFVFTGRVTKIYPVKSGTSATSNKEWKNQQFVVEEDGVKYPQSCVFTAFGDDKIAHVEQLKIGSLVAVHFNIKANASDKGHFNNVNIWKVERLDAPNNATTTQYVENQTRSDLPDSPVGNDDGELPF